MTAFRLALLLVVLLAGREAIDPTPFPQPEPHPRCVVVITSAGPIVVCR